MTLDKLINIREPGSLEFGFEFFDIFNRARFYPTLRLMATINSPTFGHVVKAAPPRIGQASAEINF
jgi:hypothetical protein